MCSKLDAVKAKKCNPSLTTQSSRDNWIYFGGQGRISTRYQYDAGAPVESSFDASSSTSDLGMLLISSYFNGLMPAAKNTEDAVTKPVTR